MKSKTKYILNSEQIGLIFKKAGLGDVSGFEPLGAGEFNAVYCVIASGKEYVLKIAPRADCKVLTYESRMLAGEIKWYERIGRNTSIRIPEIYYSDFSRSIVKSDYFIMEKLDGMQLDKFCATHKDIADSTCKLAAAAAQIHRIKNDKYGYEQNGLFDNWYTAVKSMTQNLIDDAQAVGRNSKRGRKLLEYIERHKDVLAKADCAMVNFDLWAPNVICQTDAAGSVSYAWIDPERTFWGDRIADFVALEFGKPLREKQKSIESYNAETDNPIFIDGEVEIRYYVAVAYLALIQEVEKYYRYSIIDFGWWRNVLSGGFLYRQAFGFLKKLK